VHHYKIEPEENSAKVDGMEVMRTMRKAYVPLTVLGLGGLSFLLLSRRGREILRWAAANLPRGPEKLLEWNEAAQRELDKIQIALNRVADSLGAADISRAGL
jgi:hypothetical protein